MPWLLAVLFLVPSDPSKLTVPIMQPDPKEVWMEELHACENPDNVPKILDTNGKYSYGPFMFQMDTWLSFGKPFGATPKNINDRVLQDKVARSMLDQGLWRHWYTCGKRTTAKLGEYPLEEAVGATD